MDEISIDETWDLCDRLHTECEKRRGEVQQLLDTVRATRRIPKREIEQALHLVRRFLGEIRDARIREIDRKDFTSMTKRQMAVLTFLRTRAHADNEPNGTQIQALLDTENIPDELSDRIARYEAQTMLAILSKPAGNEYWLLMRTVANRVRDDRKMHRTRKLNEIHDVLNFLAPARLLYDDQKPVPAIGKWAWRTTKVNGIYNGGLPGLGKNA